ncbi:MAG: effector binding domain-containing protein [Candidatus Hodarchaeota archaeon]
MSENIRIVQLKSMRAAYFYAFSEAPEEDSWKKMEFWAINSGLFKKSSKSRIFGRNIYPTENPEPHGYSYYITITPEIKVDKEIFIRIIPGGLYALSRCEGFEEMSNRWAGLWKWVNSSKYKYIGETKSEVGFELGFEEHLNWYPFMVEKSEKTMIFDLMLQLWEE